MAQFRFNKSGNSTPEKRKVRLYLLLEIAIGCSLVLGAILFMKLIN